MTLRSADAASGTARELELRNYLKADASTHCDPEFPLILRL
jgi:hypothetical protein